MFLIGQGRKPFAWSVMVTCALFLLNCNTADGQSNSKVQDLIRSGQAALDNGDFARAVAEFDGARHLAPEDLEANRGLLLSYLHIGDSAKAVQLGSDLVTRVAVARLQLGHRILAYVHCKPVSYNSLTSLCYRQSDRRA